MIIEKSVHCFVEDCPYKNEESECCERITVIIAETGRCLIYAEAKKKAETEEYQTGKNKKPEEY